MNRTISTLAIRPTLKVSDQELPFKYKVDGVRYQKVPYNYGSEPVSDPL